MTETPHPRGLFSSLRGLLATATQTLQTRLQLFVVELQEEQARILGLLVYGAAAVILLAFGIIFLAVFVTVLLWDSNRLLALGICTALFLAGGGLSLAMAVRLARAESRLFAASLAELAKDRADLESRP